MNYFVIYRSFFIINDVTTEVKVNLIEYNYF